MCFIGQNDREKIFSAISAVNHYQISFPPSLIVPVLSEINGVLIGGVIFFQQEEWFSIVLT
jgi:hypothetical protein